MTRTTTESPRCVAVTVTLPSTGALTERGTRRASAEPLRAHAKRVGSAPRHAGFDCVERQARSEDRRAEGRSSNASSEIATACSRS
jgi:hypothetical protein